MYPRKKKMPRFLWRKLQTLICTERMDFLYHCCCCFFFLSYLLLLDERDKRVEENSRTNAECAGRLCIRILIHKLDIVYAFTINVPLFTRNAFIDNPSITSYVQRQCDSRVCGPQPTFSAIFTR